MEMGHDQYGLSDLRHLLAGRTHFPTFSQPQDHHYSPHHTLTTSDLLMLSSQVVDHVGFSDSTTTSTTTPSLTNTTTPPLPPPSTTTTTTTSLCPFELEGGVEGGNGRWPRQETLTLLEIRSHLDSKFKEANQKGPLWDEVSRIMAEEHGYQRSGKKCREKFENLYKYYKKTKEGKAGRQDGKHYRFFRQLEALYGETSNPSTHFVGNHPRSYQTTTNHHNSEALQGQKLSESNLSISNSSCFDSSSSEEEDDNELNEANFMENNSMEKKKKMVMNDGQCSKRGKKSWKCKIRDFVDSQMRKLMETQEAWLEKMLKMIEQKERERMSREEEWRKREASRIDQEHKFWANERAWFEARDAALMEALRKITGKELKASTSTEELMGTEIQENIDNNGSETLESTVNSTDKWPESEISSLIHLRTSLESRFHGSEYSNETLWVEIASKMACLGYDRNAKNCEEKWQDINKYLRRSNECTKKRKENLRTSTHYLHFDSSYNQGCDFFGHGNNQLGIHLHNERPSPSNSNAPESCFPFLLAEGENLWENYGMKINRGENH